MRDFLCLSELSSSAAATAAVGLFASVHIGESGRIKLVNWERHVLEHATRIIRCGRNAFFFGNGVFRAVHKILRGALNSYHREKSERNEQVFSRGVGAESAVKHGADCFWQLAVAETVAEVLATASLNNLRVKYYRIDDFKNRCREIACGIALAASAAEAGTVRRALENADVTFAAVKNDLLFDDAKSICLLRATKSDADLAVDLYIHFHRHLIETAVERYRVDAHIRRDDVCALRSDVASAFNGVPAAVREINDYILKAVLVAATVQNSVGIYINRVTSRTGERHISVISHNK